MYDLKWVSELPACTKHETNSYRDKVEVERSTLQFIIRRSDEYYRALMACEKAVDEQEKIQFLTSDDAQNMAKIAAEIKYQAMKACGIPVWGCSGKVEKGSSFYTAKVVCSIDTSG